MSKSDQTYSIRHLAEEFAVTTRTLRFYEEKGLLRPTRQGNSRLYDSADRTRLKLILRGKKLGLTLDESSDIIAMYQADGRNQKQLKALLNKISEKQQQLKAQQKELNTMMSDLKTWQARCEAELGVAANDEARAKRSKA
ncbi:MAG: MerR family transcriptional regulator [Pseudomonadales bacterium]